MVYNTASNAVEVVASQGQSLFVQAIRDNILAYTNMMQRMHTVNKPRWQNTTCEGIAPGPNETAFDRYDDVRATLYSQVYDLTEGDVVLSVGFPIGSALGYHRAMDGTKSWMIIDGSTDYWMRLIDSEAWNDSWKHGKDYSTKPDLLIKSGQPFNMTDRMWYIDAKEKKKQTWSGVYYSLVVGSLAMGAVLPIYSPSGDLKLVANAQTSLGHLDKFFTKTPITPNTFAFVAEMDGSLIATFPPGLATVLSQNQSDARVRAVNSNSSLAPAARWLVQQFGSFTNVPAKDSSFLIDIGGAPHYLFTGHIQDKYGLHWLTVIGVPKSDLTGALERATTWAIAIVLSVLGLAVILMGAMTFSIRNTLKVFAQRIRLIGVMDLEEANNLQHTIYLSEAKVILSSIQTTIDNLLQIRTFVPQPMLEKVQKEEKEKASRATSRRSRSQRSEAPPVMDSITGIPAPATPVSEEASGRPATSQKVVQATFERRMERIVVTLLFVKLPELHCTEELRLSPADFLRWYERCIEAANNVCERWAGEFHRLVGDTLLYTWGAVRSTGAQCVKGCQAALQVSKALYELDGQSSDLPNYKAQLALVTGTTMCGVMGTVNRRDFYVIGPLVEYGAHLAALNMDYQTQILVDKAVARQCESMFTMQICGLVRYKKSCDSKEVHPVYELLDFIGDHARSGGDDEWMYRLVQTDSDSVGKLYAQAVDALQKGQLVLAARDLQAVLLKSPEDKHAARLLKRINGLDLTKDNAEALID